ncbi:MAG: preprotein translocase subunit SecE [Spirochaetaceae bacterium]|nr:preprotein translocase subunit SecE [Spirochaetaceae bacterium]
MKKIIQFFKECYAELKKVVWPSKEDVWSSTKVVIFSTLAMALLLGLIDFLLVMGIEVIFR